MFSCLFYFFLLYIMQIKLKKKEKTMILHNFGSFCSARQHFSTRGHSKSVQVTSQQVNMHTAILVSPVLHLEKNETEQCDRFLNLI